LEYKSLFHGITYLTRLEKNGNINIEFQIRLKLQTLYWTLVPQSFDSHPLTFP
jgi:hypothetical protein